MAKLPAKKLVVNDPLLLHHKSQRQRLGLVTTNYETCTMAASKFTPPGNGTVFHHRMESDPVRVFLILE